MVERFLRMVLDHMERMGRLGIPVSIPGWRYLGDVVGEDPMDIVPVLAVVLVAVEGAGEDNGKL